MTVLLMSVISLCPVIVVMATAFEALDIALRYLTETGWHPTPLTSDSVTWHTLYYFLYLECKEVGKMCGTCKANLYENYVVLLNVVERGVNLVFVTCIIICSNVGICSFPFTGVKTDRCGD
jgi:hypothetical protein